LKNIEKHCQQKATGNSISKAFFLCSNYSVFNRGVFSAGMALGWCWWCYSTMDFEGFCTYEPEMTPILLIRLLLAPSISNPKAAPAQSLLG